MAEVGLLPFARIALQVSRAVLPRYRTRFSKRQFTQPQLLAILCLMRYEDWTFREAEVRLSEHRELRQVLGLVSVPDFTTLYRFLQRLDDQTIDRAVGETVRRLRSSLRQKRKRARVAVDATHNSLVTIANGSDKTARAQLTILYNHGGGQYQLEQTLAPDEQMALDFGKLIHDQVPDKNGHFLPPGLTEGTYRLLDLNDNPLGSLYEGKEIVDKTYGHASYTCMICCGPDSPWMMYDPLSVLISGFENQSVQAVNSCTERQVDVTGDFPTWWTDNSSIATASGYQINGVAVGSTNHNAQSISMYWGPKEVSVRF